MKSRKITEGAQEVEGGVKCLYCGAVLRNRAGLAGHILRLHPKVNAETIKEDFEKLNKNDGDILDRVGRLEKDIGKLEERIKRGVRRELGDDFDKLLDYEIGKLRKGLGEEGKAVAEVVGMLAYASLNGIEANRKYIEVMMEIWNGDQEKAQQSLEEGNRALKAYQENICRLDEMGKKSTKKQE